MFAGGIVKPLAEFALKFVKAGRVDKSHNCTFKT